jgi:hypothetical protein
MATSQTSTDLPRYQLVIDGRRVEAASGRRYDSVDPFAGAAWASAVHEYTQTKAIWVELTGGTRDPFTLG